MCGVNRVRCAVCAVRCGCGRSGFLKSAIWFGFGANGIYCTQCIPLYRVHCTLYNVQFIDTMVSGD